MYEFLPRILNALRDTQPIALATVVKRRGSLPMATDAKLLVLADGTVEGTVGGGCLEAEVYAVATRLLRDGGASVDEFHLNEVEESTGGHVCGGTVHVLTRAFHPAAETLAFFEQAVACRDHDGEVTLASRVAAGDPAQLVLLDGVVSASLGMSSGIAGPAEAGGAEWGEDWFVETLADRPLLIVFGAGHCGVAIGAAASAAGFRVWMLEDRPPFLVPDRMPWAADLMRVDFAALPSLPLGPETSLAIVTRGHDHDLTVLRQVLDQPVAYAGMIGSRRKRALFRQILASEGRNLEAFDRVRSPMGVDIGAQTPAEIGVSVVAELIAQRRTGSVPGAAPTRAGAAGE